MIDYKDVVKFYESLPDVDIYTSDPIDPNYYSVSWGGRWSLSIIYKDKVIVGEIRFYTTPAGELGVDYNKSERYDLDKCGTDLYDKLNGFYEQSKLNYKNYLIKQKLDEIDEEFK